LQGQQSCACTHGGCRLIKRTMNKHNHREIKLTKPALLFYFTTYRLEIKYCIRRRNAQEVGS
jgi:hypothetical protein